MNVHVHVQRLVLDGVALQPRDTAALSAAVAAELTRLLELDVPVDLQRAGAISSRTASLSAPDASPDRLGSQIGDAAYRSLKEHRHGRTR